MYYHVWFVTKYRKKILEGKMRSFILESFLEICQRKNYNILEIGLGCDHAHFLLEADGLVEVSSMVRVIKAVSSLKARRSYGSFGCDCFWAKRYGCRGIISAKDLEVVRCYIREHKQ